MPFGDDTLVFKVGGKMFLMSNLEHPFDFNIKARPEEVINRIERYADTFEAYHMSKIHWITIKTALSTDDERLKQWIKESYELVYDRLPKSIKQELEK